MITAVDTNIFLDILAGKATESMQARDALRKTATGGHVICSFACYAELACYFSHQRDLDKFLQFVFVKSSLHLWSPHFSLADFIVLT